MQQNRIKRLKVAILAEIILCLTVCTGIFCSGSLKDKAAAKVQTARNVWVNEAKEAGFIKWVDFGVTYKALCQAYEWDAGTWQKGIHIDWIEMLAYLGACYGGDFTTNDKKVEKDMEKLAKKLLEERCTMEELTKDMKYYAYYEEAYRAVLGGMVGEFEIECEDDTGKVVWQKQYGLKAYSPIAKGFEYSHYDDFGSGRSYGFKRQHLGHDMMGQVGVPIRIKNRACVSENDAQAFCICI